VDRKIEWAKDGLCSRNTGIPKQKGSMTGPLFSGSATAMVPNSFESSLPQPGGRMQKAQTAVHHEGESA
jgi:hypothetical protein